MGNAKSLADRVSNNVGAELATQTYANLEPLAISGQINKPTRASQFTFQETTANSMIANASKWYFKSLDKIVSTVQKTVKFPQAPIGTSLVSNGTFDTDITGWEKEASSDPLTTISWDSGRLKVDAATSYDGAVLTTPLTLIVGKKYILEGYIELGTSTEADIREVSNNISLVRDISGYVTIEFEAVSSIFNPILRTTGNIGTVFFDNIGLFESTDLFRYDNLLLRDDGTYHIAQSETNLYEDMNTMLNFTSNLFSIVDGSDTATSVTFTYNTTTEEYTGSDGYKYITVGSTARFNRGAYHPVYNKYGTSKWRNVTLTSAVLWYNSTAIQASNITDCFDGTKMVDTYGAYSTTHTGRPDAKYYDIIYNELFIDQRWKAEYSYAGKELTTVERDKDISATQMADFVGSATWETVEYVDDFVNNSIGIQAGYGLAVTTYIQSNSNPFGVSAVAQDIYGSYLDGQYIDDAVQIYLEGNTQYHKAVAIRSTGTPYTVVHLLGDVTADFTVSATYKVIVATKSDFRYGSNTFLQTDIIGNPANYPNNADLINDGTTQVADVIQNVTIVHVTDATPVGGTITGHFYLRTNATVNGDISTFDYSLGFKDLGTSSGKGWVDILSGGGTIDGVPLLVGEKGGDYTTGTGLKKLTKKAESKKQTLYMTLSTGVWTDWGATGEINYVTNETVSNCNVDVYMFLFSYKAYNNNLAPIVNSVVEKGSAGISSCYATRSNTAVYGCKLSNNLIHKVDIGTGGNTLANVDMLSVPLSSSSSLFPNISLKPIGGLIILDNIDSPAVKLFSYLTQATRAKQVYVFKEMYFDNTQDIIQYIDAGVAFSAVVGETFVLRGFTDSAINGMTIEFKIVYATTWVATTFEGYSIVEGNIINREGEVWSLAKPWDGNGFGDDSKFNVGDNVSTVVDDNGNTVLVGQKARLYHGRVK